MTHDIAHTRSDWEQAYDGEVPDTPVDADVADLASTLAPGSALDLGCGGGQNSVSLAKQGWSVLGIDIASGAINKARRAAAEASVDTRATFETADVTTWRTSDRYDLVVSTYALPPRGRGRTHALTTARDAVTPGGTALVAEFDVSLAASGWMAEENLVTLDEVTAMFPGFDLERAEVRVTRHSHGTDARQLPIVIVVARHPRPLTERH